MKCERLAIGDAAVPPADPAAPPAPAAGAAPAAAVQAKPHTDMISRILNLAWPALTEQFLSMTVGLVNTSLVGHLGATPLAAVGLSDQLVQIFSVFFGALAVGSTALVARHIGAGDRRGADVITSQSMLMALGLGTLTALLTFLLARPALQLLGAAADVQEQGTLYLRIVAPSLLLMTVMFVGNATLRGAGNTRTPMMVMMAVNIVNVVVTYSLINGVAGLPKMGVAGSGIGAATARSVGGLAVLAILLRPRSTVKIVPKFFLHLNLQQVRRVLSIGIPAGMEQLLMRLAQLTFAAAITSLGTSSYAAYQIVMMVMSVGYMPGFGFSVASTTMVGQELGAGRPSQAEAAVKTTVKLGILSAVIVGGVLFLWPRAVASLFTNDLEVMEQALLGVRTFALAQPLVVFCFTYGGALRGAGETRPVLVVTVATIWLVRLVLGYLLTIVFGLGLVGAFIAVDLDWLVRAFLLRRLFQRGRWKTIKV
ncbi:MAG: MATE family efflux transporter [Chloroflexi bacterium]|nr:MATE family efflux transporter [Chloroflexota bacterium]